MSLWFTCEYGRPGCPAVAWTLQFRAPSVVLIPRNERLQLTRLLDRPSNPPLTETQAKSRIAAQMPLSTKLSYATHVVDNSGSRADLDAQVERLIKRWQNQQGGSVGWWWRLCWILPPIGLAAGMLCLAQNWWKARKTSGSGRRRGRGEVERRQAPEETIELQDRSRRRVNTGSSVDSD